MPLFTKSSVAVNSIDYFFCFMSPYEETSITIKIQAFTTLALLPRDGRNWWLWLSNFCAQFITWHPAENTQCVFCGKFGMTSSTFVGKVLENCSIRGKEIIHLAVPSQNLLILLSRLHMIFLSHLPRACMYFSIVSVFMGKEGSFGASKSNISWNIIT